MKESIEVHFNKSKIFLLYFYTSTTHMSIREKKNSGLSIAYSWKANAFIEFYHFMEKR